MNYVDLRTQYERIKRDLNSRIAAVLEHGRYVMGPEVVQLEEQLAAFCGVQHCIAVASGTDALLMALMVLGVTTGDEVITSPFTFIATAEMIALLGAKPIFVDIDPRTYNIDPASVVEAITPRTKVVVPVHLYGQCADMDAINSIAARYGLAVVEDAAQSFGAAYRGRSACALGTIGCTSFYPSKPLGCYGDGGACFTNDQLLADRLRQIREHGQERRYIHTCVGINGRLDTIQAAVLLAKLAIFPSELIARQEAGARYAALLTAANVMPPFIDPVGTSVYAQYTIEIGNRDEVQSYLATYGIPTAVHYPVPLHLQPVFEYLGIEKGALPVAESAAERVLSVPLHPYIEPSTQAKIVDVLSAALSHSASLGRTSPP